MANFDAQLYQPSSIIPGSPLSSASFKLSKAGSSVSAPGTTTTLPAANTNLYLSKESNFEEIALAMVSPDSTLDIRERIWLKIPVPCAFLGSDAVNWLYKNVRGFKNRKEAKSLLAVMLKEGYIIHPIPISRSLKLSEKCYYQVSDQIRAKINEATHRASLADNFEATFANTLHLTNENVQQPNSVAPAGGSAVGCKPKYLEPFMNYWDETSQVHNYGLFERKPLEPKDSSEHSGKQNEAFHGA